MNRRIWVVMNLLVAVIGIGASLGMGRVSDAELHRESGTEPTFQWEGDDAVYRQGGWELRITYLQRGTRSEGQVGLLRREGALVEPDLDAEVLQTSLGLLKHYGDDRPVLWAVSGWNFADQRDIKRSELLVPVIETGADSQMVRVAPAQTHAQVQVKVGQVLAVDLEEQAGTAYHWQLDEAASDMGGLTFTGKQVMDAPDSEPRLLGSTTAVRFSFAAESVGNASLQFEDRRPFDQPGDGTAGPRITLEVKVQ